MQYNPELLVSHTKMRVLQVVFIILTSNKKELILGVQKTREENRHHEKWGIIHQR